MTGRGRPHLNDGAFATHAREDIMASRPVTTLGWGHEVNAQEQSAVATHMVACMCRRLLSSGMFYSICRPHLVRTDDVTADLCQGCVDTCSPAAQTQ